MNHNHFSWALIIIGVFLITAGVILSDSLILKFCEINGSNSTNKIVVNLDNNKCCHDQSNFTYDDIEKLKNILKDAEITCTANSQTMLMENIEDPAVNIIGVTSEYINFCTLNFKTGFLFTRLNELENDPVAIIDENLAWKVFGSLEIVGNKIEIFDKTFEIIGVTSVDKSIITVASYNEKNNIYIPLKLLQKLDEKTNINSLQIKMLNTAISANNIEVVKKALRIIEKSPVDYHIYDYNLEKKLMEQKPLLIVFISGVICILVIVLWLAGEIKELYTFIKSQYIDDYLGNILKNNLSLIFTLTLKILTIVLGVFILWNMVKFDLYIPPDHIPNELIDIKFFLNLFKRNISNSAIIRGSISSLSLIQLNIITMFLNYFFYLALFLGFPTIYAGLYQLKLQGVYAYKAILQISWIFTLSISLSVLLVFLSNMPISIDVRSLIIVFLFFYMFSITSLKEHREEI